MELGPNQKKWIEALRSGEYKQVRNYLHVIDDKGESSFCCLGVACDLFYDGEKMIDKDSPHNWIRVAYENSISYLPDDVWYKLCLRGNSGESSDFEFAALSNRNDSGESFEYIASVLETFPEKYFWGTA